MSPPVVHVRYQAWSTLQKEAGEQLVHGGLFLKEDLGLPQFAPVLLKVRVPDGMEFELPAEVVSVVPGAATAVQLLAHAKPTAQELRRHAFDGPIGSPPNGADPIVMRADELDLDDDGDDAKPDLRAQLVSELDGELEDDDDDVPAPPPASAAAAPAPILLDLPPIADVERRVVATPAPVPYPPAAAAPAPVPPAAYPPAYPPAAYPPAAPPPGVGPGSGLSLEELFDAPDTVADAFDEPTSETTALTAKEAPADADADSALAAHDDDARFADRRSAVQQLETMSLAEKRHAAMHGHKDVRMLIVRDHNKSLHPFVLKNPAISLDEIEQIAKLTGVNPECLHTIASNRDWTRSASVVRNLVRNPKTPVPDALKLVEKLPMDEIRAIVKSASVKGPIQAAARKRLHGED